MTTDAHLYDLDAASRAFAGAVGTCDRAAPIKRASGPKSAPADLAGFLAGHTIGQVADALRLSRGTAHRLVQGYWPGDARKITRAWADYKARTARIDSGWFLRRVRAGGLVRHADADWSAAGLAERTGQLVACSRNPEGLLAQTLELPSVRLLLTRIDPTPTN